MRSRADVAASPAAAAGAPSPRALAAPLLRWYDRHRRELPWRDSADPYRVWVSEVMLQQTQVETVLRYYEPFLARFPDLDALAGADEGEVLAAWSGLGFYRRARNLHRAARQIQAEHGGRLPLDPRVLGSLPGFGRYTVGAVLSIATGQRLPILDGNVTRVLSRVFRVAGDPGRPAVSRRLWALAEEVLPERRVGDFNQALMELGALVCRPTGPRCGECPLGSSCGAAAGGDPLSFPEPGRKAKVLPVARAALAIERDGRLLLTQRPAEGLLAGLWELPARDLEEAGEADAAAAALARRLGLRARPRRAGQAEHRFSHRHWSVTVYRLSAPAGWSPRQLDAWRWVGPTELDQLGVPAVTRKLIAAAGEGALAPGSG